MKKTYLLMLLVLILNGAGAYAQTDVIPLKGTVTNHLGEALARATVTAKEAAVSAVADNNGSYSISVPRTDTLIFSAAGYQERRLPVITSGVMDVTLLPVDTKLDEVVVIGYGKQSRKFVTGAVTKAEIVKDIPNTSITQSLRGRVAGVQFTDNGRPGQNGTILIRGPRSLSAGNNPLIVVDGIIYNGVLSDVNPNDIESLEILKDASASAIYGSRAANGVILITSRKGVSEKPAINVNTFTSSSSPGYRIKLLSPERYVQKTLDARRELGQEADPEKVASYMAPNEAENYLAGRTVDPYDVATQKNAGIRSIDINMAGKTQRTNYFVSASFADEKGIILNDRQKRTTFRINLENKITNWLTAGTNTMYGRRDFSGILPNLDFFYQLSPYGTIYKEDGSPRQFVVDGENVAGNPMYNPYFRSNQQVQNNLFANFYAVLQALF